MACFIGSGGLFLADIWKWEVSIQFILLVSSYRYSRIFNLLLEFIQKDYGKSPGLLPIFFLPVKQVWMPRALTCELLFSSYWLPRLLTQSLHCQYLDEFISKMCWNTLRMKGSVCNQSLFLSHSTLILQIVTQRPLHRNLESLVSFHNIKFQLDIMCNYYAICSLSNTMRLIAKTLSDIRASWLSLRV